MPEALHPKPAVKEAAIRRGLKPKQEAENLKPQNGARSFERLNPRGQVGVSWI